MNEYKTNFSLITDILEISSVDIINVIDVDKTQISRWRSGERKLSSKSNHTIEIADLLIKNDDEGSTTIRRVLSEIYPIGLEDADSLHDALVTWLSIPDQDNTVKVKTRTKYFYTYMARKIDELDSQKDFGDNIFSMKNVSGYYESRHVLSEAVNYLADIDESTDIIFVCPEGIDIITSDEKFSMEFLNRMTGMLKKGYKLNVILRTDFKMSEVASFAGPWLVAHLSGYIKSWYYDDFRKIETDKILVWIKGKMGIRISGDDYNCRIYTNKTEVEEIGKRCKQYQNNSVQRFHYDFFDKPENYIKGILPEPESNTYLYQRLPNICIGGEDYLDEIGISKSEMEHLTEQFNPFVCPPDQFKNELYYMLCIEDLEEALDKPKYMNFTLQEILGRRVYVETQVLVNQLIRLRDLMKTNRHFHLCFMRNNVFEKIVMEIGVWERKSAIGWIKGVQSTATKDVFNILTLQGFCATVWGKIPALFKSRAAANRMLNKLLSRAEKFGYDV